MLPWKPTKREHGQQPAEQRAARTATASRKWFRAAVGAAIAVSCWRGIDSLTSQCFAETPPTAEPTATASQEVDPLEALRKRSAGDRWQRIKSQHQRGNVEKATEPATNSALPVFEPTPHRSVEVVQPKPVETKVDDGFQPAVRTTPPAVRSVTENDDDHLIPLTLPRKKVPVAEPISPPASNPAPVRSQKPKAARNETDRDANAGWIIAAPHTVFENRLESGRPGQRTDRVTPASATTILTEELLSPPPAEEVIPPPAPIAAQTIAQNTGGPRVGSVLASQGTITIRGLAEIRPMYDVEKDQRIREYAQEKLKEYKIVLSKDPYPPRAFSPVLSNWDASDLYHYPLYFEDEDLERYGHTYGDCLQPFVSIAKFSGQFLLLPYQMTIDPICTPKYSLGYYRPGECAPYLHKPIPWNAKAAAVEAGVVTGLIFLIP